MKKHFISVFSLFGLILLGKLFIGSTTHTEDPLAYQKIFESQYSVFALNVPDEVDFCGERVPLEDREVKERFDRELHVNAYWHSQTLLLMKRANRYFPIIRPILKKNGIPDDFKYLPLIESGFQDMVSPAGAEGPWQFIARTGKEYGLEINESVDERYELVKATEAACRYLKESYNRFGNWTLVAAAYNMGPFGLQANLRSQQESSYYNLHLNNETSRYVFRLLAIKEIMKNPRKYGFQYRKYHLYQQVPTYKLKVDSSITSLTAFAKSQGITYKALKEHNPWLKTSKFINTSGKTYVFHIPKKKTEASVITEEDLPVYEVPVDESSVKDSTQRN